MKIGDRPKNIADFVRSVIADHMKSDLYKTAKTADEYDRCRNTTITGYQKMITLVTGQVVPDRFAATHRMCSNFFNMFVCQLTQYLLGNGVTWTADHADKIGKDFDIRLQDLGHAALCGGVAYGFYNLDHLVVFTPLNFAAILDEETGEIRMGVRFWQLAPDKPLRAVFYEEDGLTSYLWSREYPGDEWTRIEDDAYMQAKTPYTWVVVGDAKDREDGTVEIAEGDAVPGFPIIPLYANRHKQSELVGLREKIDAYDFILNGFADDLDNAQLYWIITGAGGMGDSDLQQFLDRLRTVKATAPAEDQTVTPVPVEIPHEARGVLLDTIRKQLYADAMMMNPQDVVGGAETATRIRAAYEPQNVKADQFEYCVLDFLDALMKLAGFEDTPTFTRSTIINEQEKVQTYIESASYTGEEYTTEKILTALGDGDRVKEIQQANDENELDKINVGNDEDAEEQTE